MEPITIVIWVCVVVFVITAILTLLHVSGLYVLPNPEHGKILFKTLVVEIVVISVAAFGSYLSKPVAKEAQENEDKVATNVEELNKSRMDLEPSTDSENNDQTSQNMKKDVTEARRSPEEQQTFHYKEEPIQVPTLKKMALFGRNVKIVYSVITTSRADEVNKVVKNLGANTKMNQLSDQMIEQRNIIRYGTKWKDEALQTADALKETGVFETGIMRMEDEYDLHIIIGKR